MEKKIDIEIQKPNYYIFIHRAYTAGNETKKFFLHYHVYSEIYIYIKGKAKFQIEGATFSLNPYDVIIIPPYKLHCPLPLAGEYFERYVINISPDFYANMKCPEYEKLYQRITNFNYKIPGHSVRETGLLSALEFLNSCYEHRSEFTDAIANCKIAEILHILLSVDNFETFSTINNSTQKIINYINDNFSTIEDLQDIADYFNYSKNHLSYLFRKNTGITISKYISLKKMRNVIKLYNKGYSLTRSCIESGFNSYDNFAYIYKNEFGMTPSKGLCGKNDANKK